MSYHHYHHYHHHRYHHYHHCHHHYHHHYHHHHHHYIRSQLLLQDMHLIRLILLEGILFPCQRVSRLCIIFLDLLYRFSHAFLRTHIESRFRKPPVVIVYLTKHHHHHHQGVFKCNRKDLNQNGYIKEL
jgi:hypothetical protein